MNLFKEFLETSTVHGLVYISKAKSIWAKIFWALLVVASFSLAIVLICNSFEGWSEKPVSSVISTRAIKDLNFPNVTICPPKNTNTALNYDLVQLNVIFTASMREKVEEEVDSTFFETDIKEYMKTLLHITNENNLRAVYNGFQTIPVPLGHSGFQVKLSGASGEVSLPGFNDKNYDEGQNVGYYHYILKFPDNLGHLIGEKGKLTVELEVNIGNADKASSLEYRLGPRYQFSGNAKATWGDAEGICKEKGGHLATVTSSEESRELKYVLYETPFLGVPSIWLGGRNNEVAENWTWVDGAEWGFEEWSLNGWDEDGHRVISETEPNGGPNKCLGCYGCDNDGGGDWIDQNCGNSLQYVCGFQPDNVIKGNDSVAFTFQQHSIPKEGFHVWWKSFSNQSKDTQQSDKKPGGFLLKWKSESKFSDMEMIRTGENGHAATPDFGGEYDGDQYANDMRYTLVVMLPDDLDEAMGNGKLAVELQVHTGEGEGWKETVRYSVGQSLKYFPIQKTWEEAEKKCLENYGHLASVISPQENEELLRLDFAAMQCMKLFGWAVMMTLVMGTGAG